MSAADMNKIKQRLRRQGATAYEVSALLQEIAQRDYGSIRALSRAWRISVPYLAEVIKGTRAPGPKVLNRLGLVRQVRVTYHPRPTGAPVA